MIRRPATSAQAWFRPPRGSGEFIDILGKTSVSFELAHVQWTQLLHETAEYHRQRGLLIDSKLFPNAMIGMSSTEEEDERHAPCKHCGMSIASLDNVSE